MEEELQTTVDWSGANGSPSAMTVSEVLPPSRHNHPIVNLDMCPFWIDTGASMHISPIQTDFRLLKPITLRTVKELGSSSVIAIGISDIQLCIEKGTQIMLQNVLYIPTATVRLISVRCLTQDSNATVHFNDSMCFKPSGTSLVDSYSHKRTYTRLPYTHLRLNMPYWYMRPPMLKHGIVLGYYSSF
jgi:hypothetical protein